MKKLPIGIQAFSTLIEQDCVYVDKTKYIYELIQGKYIFFSRPRRFGKSLLCSTLQELFSGNRDLFKGLWIDKNTDYAWPVHPVIYLDLSQVAKTSAEALTESLMRHLDDIAELHDLEPLERTSPVKMLTELTMRLFAKFGSKNRVVIIIDECDKPIFDNIDKLAVAQDMRDVLVNFYEAIKPLDQYLHFVFITGIIHFSKTSVFSGMTSIFSGINHLNNISMDPKFAHLVGFTQDETSLYFQEHLQQIADYRRISASGEVQEVKNKLNGWYNGYRFWGEQQLSEQDQEGKELARVYNPFTVINFLHKAEFRNYWFDSVDPAFLMKVLKQKQYPMELCERLKAGMNELMMLDIENISLATLLFQTGYETIRDYDPVCKQYSLKMSNYEVNDSLMKRILAEMTGIKFFHF